MTELTPRPGKSYRVRMDDRRRPTLPPLLLQEAGISAGAHELVAHVEGSGRIVLEDPQALLDALQAEVAEGMRARGSTTSLEESLLDDRATDASLE